MLVSPSVAKPRASLPTINYRIDQVFCRIFCTPSPLASAFLSRPGPITSPGHQRSAKVGISDNFVTRIRTREGRPSQWMNGASVSGKLRSSIVRCLDILPNLPVPRCFLDEQTPGCAAGSAYDVGPPNLRLLAPRLTFTVPERPAAARSQAHHMPRSDLAAESDMAILVALHPQDPGLDDASGTSEHAPGARARDAHMAAPGTVAHAQPPCIMTFPCATGRYFQRLASDGTGIALFAHRRLATGSGCFLLAFQMRTRRADLGPDACNWDLFAFRDQHDHYPPHAGPYHNLLGFLPSPLVQSFSSFVCDFRPPPRTYPGSRLPLHSPTSSSPSAPA
ncbi:hypothetical protein EVG20_g857 [Dentipellis fragilis]|uniref:Uncharacterized protein n=1 Tax=Dentipellis fragilis TaxID=205917 RepID=A0A4Y9ZC65_9AGAM|nr:hypothetical protein EVG20_g857 [Dentipellis fragilis]